MIVLDTHALLWWVSDSGQVSARARRAIDRSLRQGPVVVSAITVLEIATAVRRGRLELGSPLDRWLADLLSLPEVRVEPVTVEIARIAGGFDDTAPGDPADRIIMATAQALGATLITADDRRRRSPTVPVIW